MPTSSTSKIAAGKTQNGIYSRHKRPKSCKYDTYRLRSRHSQVEENLFGEPLKNKLMARSRSMEAISNGDATPPPSEPTLYDRRVTDQRPKHLCPRDDVKRPERPRTALATMRTPGNNNNPEFERRSSGQGGEPGIVHVVTGDQVRSLIVPYTNTKAQPLILSRRDFEKIVQAAKIMTNGEKEAISQRKEEAREAALKAAQERKEEFETLASFHHTPDETEMEKENRLRDHHLIERANELKMEQMQEIKKLNQHIIQVKCHAIRDVQVDAKEKLQNEMVSSDKRLEEQIELERKQAEEMEAARAARTAEFHKDFRQGLDVQKAELEAQKLLDKERFEAELALRRSHEAALREKDIKDAETKRLKMIELQNQMVVELEETRIRKEIEAELVKKNEERIQSLQDTRRQAEIRIEEEAKKQKRERERDMMRMKAAVEKEQELKLKREELRLIRQQEEKEKQWRQQNLTIARMEAQRNEEMRRVRAEQMRQREEIAAISVERDKLHWEEVRKTWQASVDQDRDRQEKRANGRRDYLTSLQNQISVRDRNREQLRQDMKEDKAFAETERDVQQNRIQRLKEKKLQQLKAYNVPEKYIRDIERKNEGSQINQRFTKSYFGLK